MATEAAIRVNMAKSNWHHLVLQKNRIQLDLFYCFSRSNHTLPEVSWLSIKPSPFLDLDTSLQTKCNEAEPVCNVSDVLEGWIVLEGLRSVGWHWHQWQQTWELEQLSDGLSWHSLCLSWTILSHVLNVVRLQQTVRLHVVTHLPTQHGDALSTQNIDKEMLRHLFIFTLYKQ